MMQICIIISALIRDLISDVILPINNKGLYESNLTIVYVALENRAVYLAAP